MIYARLLPGLSLRFYARPPGSDRIRAGPRPARIRAASVVVQPRGGVSSIPIVALIGVLAGSGLTTFCMLNSCCRRRGDASFILGEEPLPAT